MDSKRTLSRALVTVATLTAMGGTTTTAWAQIEPQDPPWEASAAEFAPQDRPWEADPGAPAWEAEPQDTDRESEPQDTDWESERQDEDWEAEPAWDAEPQDLTWETESDEPAWEIEPQDLTWETEPSESVWEAAEPQQSVREAAEPRVRKPAEPQEQAQDAPAAAAPAAAAPAAAAPAAAAAEPQARTYNVPVVRTRTWRTAARPKAIPHQPNSSKRYALDQVVQRSWPLREFRCLDSLWTRESGWNHRAYNRSSGAYGIPQALPGGKMRGAGADWRHNPQTQIRWGLAYIKGRYGRPCGAWGHFRSHNWY